MNNEDKINPGQIIKGIVNLLKSGQVDGLKIMRDNFEKFVKNSSLNDLRSSKRILGENKDILTKNGLYEDLLEIVEENF